MSMIGCILPDKSLVEHARLAFGITHTDIRIEIGLMDEGVKQAAVLAREGFEIFISRGRTAFLIREASSD